LSFEALGINVEGLTKLAADAVNVGLLGAGQSWLEHLEAALGLIVDPVQRQAEFATALAEMRAGRLPSIILRAIGGES
jgi:hypothetical protein